jgi:uncharacterized membrane protein
MNQLQDLSLACPDCGVTMPAAAGFCPGCGRQMNVPQRVLGKVGVLPEPIAGALAYLTFIPAVVFLLVEPYKRNLFVRFHSVQCLLLCAAAGLAAAILKLASSILFLIPLLGALVIGLASGLCALAVFVTWLVLIVKALQGEMFEIPFLGRLAARYAQPEPSPPAQGPFP